MNFFARRRLRNTLLSVSGMVVAYALWRMLKVALRPTAIYTGFALLALVLALALFNGRKKLPFLPLLKASSWLQFHIYAGWFSVFMFLLHSDFRLPSGMLEIILAVLFAIVALSGVAGLFITRLLPPAITRSGEPLVYERIPRYRHALQTEVENIVEEAERKSGSTAMGNFYMETLAPYFQGSSSVFLLAGNPSRHAQRILGQMDEYCRYLDKDLVDSMGRLRDCVERKRNLDFQNAAQRLLKLWLFVHIPFTYSLILVALAHAWIALVYEGRF
ncbi:MAG: hypothetical protein R3F13_00440 [Prosthecobacter sp.]